jgi:hypothetical protein
MIVVKLHGGLGNQMFQYAFGRQLSLIHSTVLKYDDGFFQFNNDSTSTRREFELNVFNTKITKASNQELSQFLNKSRIQKRLEQYFPFLETHRLIHEKFHPFDPSILLAKNNTYLSGYWQSEKYFTGCRSELLQDFILKQPPGRSSKALEERCKKNNAVAIHIRRGDYVSRKANTEYHGVCSLEYYYKAIQLIGSKMQTPPELLVFSDDMPWVKEHFKPGMEFYCAEENTGQQSVYDLYFMSLCRHNIVANSSFSWWGAWLNTHRDKIVVAPKQWYATDTIDSSQIAPESWIRV